MTLPACGSWGAAGTDVEAACVDVVPLGAGGVADAGRDHPGPGEGDIGAVAVSLVVTRRG